MDNVIITSTRIDIALLVNFDISLSNSLRAHAPEVYDIYEKVLRPNISCDADLTVKEIARKHHETYHKTVCKKQHLRIIKTFKSKKESAIVIELENG